MTQETDINLSRRNLLKKLGLAAGVAYVAPTLAGLDIARASTGSSSSNSGRSSGPSGPSRSSRNTASRPSRPSGSSRNRGSRPSRPSRPTSRNLTANRSSNREQVQQLLNQNPTNWVRNVLGRL